MTGDFGGGDFVAKLVHDALDAGNRKGPGHVGGIALGEPVFEARIEFEPLEHVLIGQHVGQHGTGSAGQRAVHVGEEPLPFGTGFAFLPELAVVKPGGVVAIGFGDDEVHEAVEIDAGFNEGPVGGSCEIGRIDEVHELQPVHRVAFFHAEGDDAAGDVAVKQVIDLAFGDLISLGEPSIIPAFAHVVEAEVLAVDEDHTRAVIGDIHLEEAVGEFRPHAVAQHFVGPAVAAIAEGQGLVDGCPLIGENVVFDFVIAVFAAHGQIEGFLRVDPVVFATDADADIGAEGRGAAGGEELDVAWCVLAFIYVAIAERREGAVADQLLVLVVVDADGVSEKRLGIGDNGNVGEGALGFVDEIGAGQNLAGGLAGLEAFGAQHGGGGELDRAGVEWRGAGGIAAIEGVTDGSGRCGESNGLWAGMDAAGKGGGHGVAGDAHVIDDGGGIGRARGAIGKLDPVAWGGGVAAVGNIRDLLGVADRIERCGSDLVGGDGKVETQIRAVDVRLVDFHGDDVVAGNKQ